MSNIDILYGHRDRFLRFHPFEHPIAVQLGGANPQVELERALFPDDFSLISREQVIGKLIPYVEQELQFGTRLKNITRHLFGLFHGLPGACVWRRNLGMAETFESLKHMLFGDIIGVSNGRCTNEYENGRI